MDIDPLLGERAGMREQRADTVIYVVAGRAPVNDRVNKVASLSRPAFRTVLVTPEANPGAGQNLVVPALPNPTNVLRAVKLWRLKRTVDHLLFFPSQKILYTRAAGRALRKRIGVDIAQGRKVVLLTCVPPHDVGMVGLLLKKNLPQIYWIMDWQDLWSYDENYFERVPRMQRRRLLKLECGMMAMIDLNVTTNPYAKTVLKDYYGIPEERITSIPHHYSPEDLATTGPERAPSQPTRYEGKPLKIGFLGTFYKPPRVRGDLVSDAVGELRTSGLDVELHVHGATPREDRAALERMRGNGVVFHGSASHKDSLSALLAYDFLMLMLADLRNSRAVMSIKLPHYLLVDRPILAIVPEPSAVADIVKQTGSGHVININQDWQRRLAEIVSDRINGSLPPVRNLREIEQYSWTQISAKWRTILARETVAAVGEG